MTFKYRVRGYFAARKDKGTVTICLGNKEAPTKQYLTADLNEVLEVCTGRRAWCHVKERVHNG